MRRIYALLNCGVIDSGNGLASFRHQIIAQINIYLSPNRSVVIHLGEILIQVVIFITENVLKTWTMVDLLSLVVSTQIVGITQYSFW